MTKFKIIVIGVITIFETRVVKPFNPTALKSSKIKALMLFSRIDIVVINTS